jgi:KaiC/GvpD/RAD55 family RecA-like ATPase
MKRGQQVKKYDLQRIGKKRKGYSLLVYAGSGGGKTTISYQIMKEYLKKAPNEFGLYITFEQSAEDQEEALVSVGVLEENEKSKIIVVDEPYIMADLGERYESVKDAAEDLKDRYSQTSLKTDPRVEQEIVKPLLALKEERDRLLQISKEKVFTLTPSTFKMLAEAVLKKKHFMEDEQIQRVLEIGIGGRKPTPDDGIWWEVSNNKELKRKYKELEDAMEHAGQTLTMNVMDYIEMEIKNASQDAMDGYMEDDGIPAGSKLGIVALDSLQLIESKLEIGKDEDEIRKLWGMALRELKEKYATYIIGVLERRSGTEEANTLPEAYAFDCILEISVTREGRKKIYRDIRVVKARNMGHVQEQQPITFTDYGLSIGSIED